MLVAEQNHHLIFADEVRGNPANLICPSCHQKVIFRNGSKKIAHFAHRHAELCGFSEGETAEHLCGKQQLYNLALKKKWHPHLEMYLPQIAQRPDILLGVRGKRIALEFQCSPLSLERLRERNAGYHREKVTVWWLLGSPYQRKLGKQKICQFTQLLNGQPFVLFWDIKKECLEKRVYYYCSYSKEQGNRLQILRQQIKALEKLRFNKPSLMVKELTIMARQHQRQLAQCPLVCHDLIPSWPALHCPVLLWRIKVILRLANFPLFTSWTVTEWFNLLVECGNTQWLMGGCIDQRTLQRWLIDRLTADLCANQILIKNRQSFILIRRAQWQKDPLNKVKLLQQQLHNKTS